MKVLCAAGLQPQQLMQMLGTALQRQANSWKPSTYSQPKNSDVEISPAQRDEIVQWLAGLNRRFNFYPETLALSIAILDKFLQTVKVRPKYLRCVGITCFYLAAKTCEEDEVIPATSELVEESECGRTVSEVLRMERVILDKFGWDLNIATPLDFLHIFHALILSKVPHLLDNWQHISSSRQLAMLTEKLFHCMSSHRMASFPPALLALSVLSLELEMFMPEWFAATVWLQSLIQVDNQQLICCREHVSEYLAMIGSDMSVYNQPLLTVTTSKTTTKRKAEEMQMDDDVYDSIKSLYNEEQDHVSTAPSCSWEMHQDSATSGANTAPQLQVVAN